MKKILHFILAQAFCINHLTAQNYYWAKQLSSDDPFTTGIVALDMALDQSGNIFICGYFAGTVDFDHGPGVANLTPSGTDYDMFIAKYDNTGNYLWAHNIGGFLSDQCKTIATDISGNVYLAGYYGGVADFDPGVGVQSLSFTGDYDMFIAKYDGNGNYVWAKGMNGLGGKEVHSMGLDGSGNIYVVGDFQQTVDFDPGTGVQNLTVAGAPTLYNMFIAKYDNNGDYVWANKIETPTLSYIAVDNSGNINLTGSYAGSTDFDPGTGATILPNSGSYIARYNNNGNLIFAFSFGGLGSHAGVAIDLDPTGSIYVKGHFDGIIDFDPGPGTANLTAPFSAALYFAKYDAGGNYQWAKTLPVSILYPGPGRTLLVDNNSDIILCGQLNYTADFDPGPATANVMCIGGTCIYLAKYDNNGNYLSAFGIGNMLLDSKATSSAVSSTGNIFMCGNFGGTNDFDHGNGVDTLTAISTNGFDLFMAAYSPGPVNVEEFISGNHAVNIFPNPVTERMNVEMDNGQLKHITIFDTQMRIIFEHRLSDSVAKTTIDLTGLKNGIYFVRINTNDWIKFLKQ